MLGVADAADSGPKDGSMESNAVGGSSMDPSWPELQLPSRRTTLRRPAYFGQYRGSLVGFDGGIAAATDVTTSTAARQVAANCERAIETATSIGKSCETPARKAGFQQKGFCGSAVSFAILRRRQTHVRTHSTERLH